MMQRILVATLITLPLLVPARAQTPDPVGGAADCSIQAAQTPSRATGSNATLIVTAAAAAPARCVVVHGERGQVVGYGQVRDGRGAVIIVGDDVMTDTVVEGARDGERLHIVDAGISAVTDLVTEEPVADLRYQADALWQAELAASEQPAAWELAQNYPNPFNPTTTIRYAVPEAAEVQVTVYNVLGEAVATLAEGPHAPGTYAVTLDARSLASGLYVYRLTAGRHQATRTMTLVK